MKNIYVFAFATFGNPNGFRQSAFIYDQESFVQNINVFDLTNAIKVFPNSIVYAIRKELVNGSNAISYCIYTYAKEPQSSREGSFIGSCITYANGIADEIFTISKLLNFHKALIANNTSNDVLIINHSDYFSIPESVISDFERINSNLRDIDNIDFISESNNNLIIYSRIGKDELCDNLKKSLELLNKYNTIYFTNNRDVIEYSKQRSIYSVTDEKAFLKEVEVVQRENGQKIIDFILYLETEKKKWKEETQKVRSYQYNEIENIKKIHDENGKKINESISRLERVSEQYIDFSRLIDTHIIHLNSGIALGKIKELYSKNKIEFSNRLNDILQPIKMKILQNEKSNRNFLDGKQEVSEKKVIHDYENHENIYKILAFILGGLLLLSIIFSGLWYTYHTPYDQKLNKQVEQKNQVELKENDLTITHITPFPLNKALILNSGLPDLPFTGIVNSNSVLFEGTVTDRGGGMVLEDRILLKGAKKIMIKVNGSSTAGNIFFEKRLFKLEINSKIIKTANIADQCDMDTEYINAKDGEYEFPLSETNINQGYIEKFQIVFYRCTIKNLNLSIWLQ